CQQYNNFPISF
nr:immunoglobulin light chain junction region [Macaca mulatta]